MDDCIECFEHILQRLHFHCVHTQIAEEECNAFHCLSHALFAMKIIERRFCTHCGKCEARTPYNQYVQYVSTPALIERAAAYSTGNQQKIKLSFGSMVRLVSTQGEIRDCAVASCGSRVQLRKTLLNAPKVLAIGLNYENERPSIDQIADVFKLIDTFIRLSDVSGLAFSTFSTFFTCLSITVNDLLMIFFLSFDRLNSNTFEMHWNIGNTFEQIQPHSNKSTFEIPTNSHSNNPAGLRDRCSELDLKLRRSEL